MRYIFVVIYVLLFIGCASKEAGKGIHLEKESYNPSYEKHDLKNIPQDIKQYTKNIDINIDIYDIQKKYEKYYFSMWNVNKPRESLSSIKWPFNAYRFGSSYGENLELIEEEFFTKMLDDSNFENYATLNKKAVTLKHVNIRSFPTNKPLLKDPTKAGEGFPFDYLQNSAVFANKPILVSHYSKNREWVYIFSSFANGWIKASDIVFLEKEQTDKWQKAQQVFITKDNVSIFSNNGDFLFKSKIGMMLALVDEGEKDYTVLAVSKYTNSKPFYLKAKVSKKIANKGILNLNRTNLENIISEISKSNYGWGGLYGQRDCSSTLRDLYAPFGIWLPRNSSQQAVVGKVFKLDELSDDEKIALIKEKGIPFQTLLHKQGHIVLYIGTFNDEVMIFHNVWGIKTKENGVDGRIVLGKAVISTLKLGINEKNYDQDAEILKNLKSMNIITM